MKSKLFGILLLFCLVVPVSATFFALRFERKIVRKEVKRKIISGMDKQELVKMSFSEDDIKSKLKWKHSKEFEYNGEMYDVVECLKSNDTTIYWLWWDHEETELNKKLNSLTQLALGNNPKNQESQKQLYFFYKSLYFKDDAKSISVNPIEVRHKQELFFKQRFYQSILSFPPGPPPKLV